MNDDRDRDARLLSSAGPQVDVEKVASIMSLAYTVLVHFGSTKAMISCKPIIPTLVATNPREEAIDDLCQTSDNLRTLF
jgi:hypothetical protein